MQKIKPASSGNPGKTGIDLPMTGFDQIVRNPGTEDKRLDQGRPQGDEADGPDFLWTPTQTAASPHLRVLPEALTSGLVSGTVRV